MMYALIAVAPEYGWRTEGRTMYDDLVERLRAQAEVERFYTGEEMLYSQAADAIEELSKRVPPVPHGRLIDADAFFDDLLFPSKQFEQGMRELIGDAPTIIEAEEDT